MNDIQRLPYKNLYFDFQSRLFICIFLKRCISLLADTPTTYMESSTASYVPGT